MAPSVWLSDGVHRWQRWWNAFRLRALRDLYEDPRVTRKRLAGRLAAGA